MIEPVFRSAGWSARLLAAALLVLCVVAAWPWSAHAAEAAIGPGRTYWYLPEHETLSRDQFFAGPSFEAQRIAMGTRKRQFTVLGARRGWAQLELAPGSHAFAHVRVLTAMLYDPDAPDLHYEFKRASLFAEDPEKIEARLKETRGEPGAPKPTAGKTPSWKRYKDAWNVKGIRRPSGQLSSQATEDGRPGTPVPGTDHSGRSLLPPIISPEKPLGQEQVEAPDPATERR